MTERRDPAEQERELRRELSVLEAEKVTLGIDDIARRGQIRVRRDEITSELRELTSGDPETIARWTQRAAEKPVEPSTTPVLVSPTEGGGNA